QPRTGQSFLGGRNRRRRGMRRDVEARLILKAWRDDTFRRALLRNPRAVFEKETGISLPVGAELHVLEETPGVLYLVLPLSPEEFTGPPPRPLTSSPAKAAGEGGTGNC